VGAGNGHQGLAVVRSLSFDGGASLHLVTKVLVLGLEWGREAQEAWSLVTLRFAGVLSML
jgi:hypothetical protein